ncbi:hypothetical protein SGLAM104S_03529 [Streptomyces glaucescens]
MPAARLSRLAALAARAWLSPWPRAVVPAGTASARPLPAQAAPAAEAAAVTTADSAQLKTWWHDNHEYNTTSPVANDKVRRSSFYDVQVATAAAPAARFDSSAYMSIPRSGKGKIGYTKEDGAEFSSSAWSYDELVVVPVRHRRMGGRLAEDRADHLVGRPGEDQAQQPELRQGTRRR